MVDPIFLDEDVAPEELIDVGSFNHSYIQTWLASLIMAESKNDYMTLVELSLDVSDAPDSFTKLYKNEVKPDISIYKRRPIRLNKDTLRMSEMPLVAIEVVSPMQGYQPILDKVESYFALGIRSCWIVHPAVPVISVYDSPSTYTSFTSGNVVDAAVNIHVPFAQIFNMVALD